MEREKRNNIKQNENDISKRKWYSVVGFLISITLLSIAIFMSINQENNERLARLNSTDVSSTELTRDLNEVKADKTKQTLMNLLTGNEVNQIDNNVQANGNVSENTSASATNSTSENYVNANSNTVENEQNEEEKEGNQTNEISNNGEEQTNNKDNKNEFVKPVEGETINIFSMDRLVYSNTLQEWVTHRGLDIKAEKKTEVKASKSGTIKSIKNDPRYGTSITIEHDGGFTTVYSCLLSTADLTEGESVEQGQVIGNVGNSGVFEVSDGMHLHFEILKDGEYVNPDIYIK